MKVALYDTFTLFIGIYCTHKCTPNNAIMVVSADEQIPVANNCLKNFFN